MTTSRCVIASKVGPVVAKTATCDPISTVNGIWNIVLGSIACQMREPGQKVDQRPGVPVSILT